MEDSVRAQLADLLTYYIHEKEIKVPKVTTPSPLLKVILGTHTLFFDGAFKKA